MARQQSQKGKYLRTTHLNQHSKYAPKSKAVVLANPKRCNRRPQYGRPACSKVFHVPMSAWKRFPAQHPNRAGRSSKYSALPQEGGWPRLLQYRCKKDCSLDRLDSYKNKIASFPANGVAYHINFGRTTKRMPIEDVIKNTG